MNGFIRKIISNDYFVIANNKEYILKAKGVFKNQNITPKVGDNIIFSYDETTDFGVIEKIEKRKNSLIRPAVSNVDYALIVMSTKEPDFDAYLVDKLIVSISLENIKPVIICNKKEFMDDSLQSLLDNYKKAGYIVIECSAKSGENVDKIHDLIKGKRVVLCGQSAVGKSSLVNALLKEEKSSVGSYSTKLGRGRHETRVCEFLPIDDAFIADTPGFSSFEIKEDLSLVSRVFLDFDKYASSCRFNTCLHVNEPGCHVKKMVEDGIIDERRYQNYLHLLREIKDGKKVWRKK